MKQLIKNNLKVLIAIILTAIICIGGSVYAAIRMQADDEKEQLGKITGGMGGGLGGLF